MSTVGLTAEQLTEIGRLIQNLNLPYSTQKPDSENVPVLAARIPIEVYSTVVGYAVDDGAGSYLRR